MQIIENIALITINATMIFQLISFFVFMLLLNKVMIRPLRRIINERETYFEEISLDITSAEDSFEEIGWQIKAQEGDTRKAALKIQDEVETAGRESASKVIAKTKQEIDHLRSIAQRDAEGKITAARQEIQKEAEAIADQMIASLLGRRNAS